MATGTFVVIEAIGTFAGQTCFNQFTYYSDVDIPGLDSLAIATVFVNDIWTAEWQPLVTDDFTLLEVRAQTFAANQANSSPQYIFGVNEQGTVVDEALGPNIVVNLFWVPDNADIYPTDAEPFKNGRSGFSGIAENVNDDGLMTSAAITDWQALATELEEITVVVSGTPHTLPMALYRRPQPNAIPPVLYPYNEQPRVPIVNSYPGQKLGTRNSRKR